MNNITWNACKAILKVVSPIQRVLDLNPAETHVFLNTQGVKILYNDGYKKISNYMNNYIVEINKGVVWADQGWKNFAHYLDPYQNKGIWPWPDAKLECNYYFNKAIKFWRKGNIGKSMFFLGAAVHLVQDMCVPHHARGVALNGHSSYERWVQHHFPLYSVNSNGIYNIAPSVDDWITYNARIAWSHYPDGLGCTALEDYYHQTTTILLAQAQRTTAGFLLYFFNTITTPANKQV